MNIVTTRSWRHKVTWRHRWRQQSTRRRHFNSCRLFSESSR